MTVSVETTVDEARLMANVNERAQRLFEDGYRAERLDEFAVEITTPKGRHYLADTLTDRCDCAFFLDHKGLRPCKHLLGLEKLLEDQERQQTLSAEGLPPDDARERALRTPERR